MGSTRTPSGTGRRIGGGALAATGIAIAVALGLRALWRWRSDHRWPSDAGATRSPSWSDEWSTSRGAGASDVGVVVPPDIPEADALEQARAVVPDDDQVDRLPDEVPLEVPVADLLDQSRAVLGIDDDHATTMLTAESDGGHEDRVDERDDGREPGPG